MNQNAEVMHEYELIDNAARQQYEFHVDGQIAKIEYIKTRNGLLYLTHTEVPPSLEGRGIGSALVEKVLEDAESKGLEVVPQCAFVARYIMRHPEWERVVVKEVTAE